ncbi:helicase-associated domain-containing protein [Paenibacillus solani]|uniref:helicase-associated domain-containing protein n=1 Tax=Paenibacillus solani TaxID=1705565 RepID=UPI003D2B5A41
MKQNPRDTTLTPSLLDIHPKERSVLRHIWSRYAGQCFDDSKLRSMYVQRLSGMEVQLAFHSLLQQGWLQTVTQGWGDRLYYIPFDKLQILQEGFGHLELPYKQQGHVKLQQEGRSGITVDIFNIAVYMTKNRLALTAKGVLHKKIIQKLEQIVDLRPSDVDGLGLPYVHADVYPSHIAIVLDLLHALELVSPGQGVLKLNLDVLRGWLQLSHEAMDRIILRYMMERYVPTSAEYQHYVFRICHSSLTGGQWHALEQKMPNVEGKVSGDQLDHQKFTSAAAIPWLQLLTGCGYTDMGVDDEGDLMFRWRRPPCSLYSDDSVGDIRGGKLFVQADFEILIPPDVPNTVKFTAARCTERVSDDRMTVYRLTRESVAQSAKAGMGPDKITAFLMEHAAAGIPENVLTALVQWGKEVKRSDLSGHGTSEEEQEICWTGKNQKENHCYTFPCSMTTLSSGLIRPARSELALAADHTLPDLCLSPPDLNHIPVMWTREWRVYHRSTAKQMMEQALECSAKLELAIGDSRMEFIPLQLERQPWKISGALYDPKSEQTEVLVTLGEGEWQEMRLVIP